MSNEIKDDETIHPDKETNEDQDERSTTPHIDQPMTTDLPTEENQETELPSNSTSDHPETSLETSTTDVIIEEKEDSTSMTTSSSEIPFAQPRSDEDAVDTVQPTVEETVPVEINNQADDTPHLLRIIADKSNKEASSTILNTVSS